MILLAQRDKLQIRLDPENYLLIAMFENVVISTRDLKEDIDFTNNQETYIKAYNNVCEKVSDANMSNTVISFNNAITLVMKKLPKIFKIVAITHNMGSNALSEKWVERGEFYSEETSIFIKFLEFIGENIINTLVEEYTTEKHKNMIQLFRKIDDTHFIHQDLYTKEVSVLLEAFSHMFNYEELMPYLDLIFVSSVLSKEHPGNKEEFFKNNKKEFDEKLPESMAKHRFLGTQIPARLRRTVLYLKFLPENSRRKKIVKECQNILDNKINIEEANSLMIILNRNYQGDMIFPFFFKNHLKFTRIYRKFYKELSTGRLEMNKHFINSHDYSWEKNTLFNEEGKLVKYAYDEDAQEKVEPLTIQLGFPAVIEYFVYAAATYELSDIPSLTLRQFFDRVSEISKTMDEINDRIKNYEYDHLADLKIESKWMIYYDGFEEIDSIKRIMDLDSLSIWSLFTSADSRDIFATYIKDDADVPIEIFFPLYNTEFMASYNQRLEIEDLVNSYAYSN